MQTWHATLGDCHKELRTIVAHLDSSGVNLDVVYALDVIHRSLIRMEAIIAVLIAPVGPQRYAAGKSLLREVVRGRLADRSLRSLARNSFRLLARKIVEWAGKPASTTSPTIAPNICRCGVRPWGAACSPSAPLR